MDLVSARHNLALAQEAMENFADCVEGYDYRLSGRIQDLIKVIENLHDIVDGIEEDSLPLFGTATLFVYGTLMRGFGNHHYLDGQTFLRKAETQPAYTLYGQGVPFMVPGGQTAVKGELYEVDVRQIRDRIDRLEAHPDVYTRTLITLDDGTEAWAYLSKSTYFGRVIPDGDFCKDNRGWSRRINSAATVLYETEPLYFDDEEAFCEDCDELLKADGTCYHCDLIGDEEEEWDSYEEGIRHCGNCGEALNMMGMCWNCE